MELDQIWLDLPRPFRVIADAINFNLIKRWMSDTGADGSSGAD